MTTEIHGWDAFSRREVAQRIETVGVAKAQMPLLPLAMLGILAGAFIGPGSMLFVIVHADPGLGFSASRLVGGLVFSLRVLLVGMAVNLAVVIAGNLLGGSVLVGRPPCRS